MFEEVCKYRPCAEGKSGNVSRWGTTLGQQGVPQQQQYYQQDKGGADSKMQVDDHQCKWRLPVLFD